MKHLLAVISIAILIMCLPGFASNNDNSMSKILWDVVVIGIPIFIVIFVFLYYMKYVLPNFQRLFYMIGIKCNPDIESILNNFRAINNLPIYSTLWFAPWILLSLAIFDLLQNDYEFMGLSLLLTIASCVFIFNHLMRTIPEALGILWNRSIIHPAILEQQKKDEILKDDTFQEFSKDSLLLENSYKKYIYNFEKNLNNLQGQLICAVICVSIGVFIAFYDYLVYIKKYEPLSSIVWKNEILGFHRRNI